MHGHEALKGSYGAEQVLIERGTAAHLAEVLAMAETCADAPHWPADAWKAFVQPGTADEHRVLLVARGGQGEMLGWLAASGMFEVAELEFLLVQPAARRLGVGRALVRCWMRAMEQAGVREALLEVRSSNLPAQRLYEALGFQVERVRRGYYEQPREDALLMRCVLGAVDQITAE